MRDSIATPHFPFPTYGRGSPLFSFSTYGKSSPLFSFPTFTRQAGALLFGQTMD